MLLKVRMLIVSPMGRSDKKEATAFLSCASAVPPILIESSKQRWIVLEPPPLLFCFEDWGACVEGGVKPSNLAVHSLPVVEQFMSIS